MIEKHRVDKIRGFRVPMPASRTWFYPEDPKPEEFFIEDIAHKLALQCRYGGGTLAYYSVAEHCVILSKAAPPQYALDALLHDRAEAYLQDFIRPVKEKAQPWYGEMERALEVASAPVFGVADPIPEEVMKLDYRICIDEKRALIPCQFHAENSIEEGEHLGVKKFHCWLPYQARRAFMERYKELTG